MELADELEPLVVAGGDQTGRGLCERGLGLLGDRVERGRIADGEIREDLAVELDAGLAAAVDELVVRQPVWRGRQR